MNETIKQLAYNFASSVDTGKKVAREMYKRFPAIAEGKWEDDVKAEVVEAFQLRYAENNPNVEHKFILRDGQYVIAQGAIPKNAETINLSVSFAMSYSAQKFGQMRTSEDAREKALYSLIKPLRDSVNKYVSNTIKTLERYAREISNEGKPRERGANLNYSQWVAQTLEQMRVRCKNAKARGDDTANDKLLAEALIAFNTVWNHK